MRTRYAISEFFSFALSIAALACGAVVSAGAQSSSSSLPAADNNGQDFTRPQNLFQIRNLYQTTPANGSVPGRRDDRHDHPAVSVEIKCRRLKPERGMTGFMFDLSRSKPSCKAVTDREDITQPRAMSVFCTNRYCANGC
jgi:hypothetical protein